MRVAVADDSSLFRQGLVALLIALDVAVVAEARTGDELLARLHKDRPDVVILDIRMPPTHTDEGLNAAAALKRQHPSVGVLLLSTYAEAHYAARLLAISGHGVGYLLKDRVEDVSTLLDALTRISNREVVVDPGIVAELLRVRAQDHEMARLTAREHDVLREMAQGRSNAGIAKALYLSPKTVEAHVAGVFSKLDIPSGTHANRRVLAVLTWLRAQPV